MLGPSGSGKTTTLRMIAGFELPTAGRVLLHGQDVTDVAAVRPRRQHGLPGLRPVPAHDRRRQRRLRADDPQGPEGRAGRPGRRGAPDGPPGGLRRAQAGQLSGGQRQRVALARALVNRPRVLLLDEPLGALDLKLRQEMQIELKAIQQQVGITFIYVTHDQEEALTMSDRIAVFNARPDRAGRARRPRSTSDPRRASWRASSGTSNLLTGDVAEADLGRPGTFTVRPEKIHLGEPGRRGRAGRDRGAPARSATSSTSARHALPRGARRGGRLVVIKQNLTTSSMEALAARARLSAWSGSDSTSSPSPMGRAGRPMEEEHG